MKVLTIGMDRRLFEEGSAVRARNVKYGAKMEELHIIVYSLKKDALSETKISQNVFLHPTNSLSRYLYVIDAIRLGKKIIVNSKFVRGQSVISCQDPYESGIPAWRLSRHFRLPLYVQVHSDFFSPYFKNSFFNIIGVMVAQFIIPRAQGIRVVSKKIADSLREKFPNLQVVPEVLPIFVDIQKIKNEPVVPDLRSQFYQFNFIFLMASRLVEGKEVETALHALGHIISEFPHTGMIIAGAGPEKNKLERLARTLGIDHHLVFIGWQDDLIPYFKMANAFLLTSRYEGYGMTLIEAGASGIPIITTDVGVVGDLFKDSVNSFVCPVGDIDCFTDRMKKIISDNTTRELFKQRIKDTMESILLSEDDYTAKYVDLLEKTLTS